MNANSHLNLRNIISILMMSATLAACGGGGGSDGGSSDSSSDSGSNSGSGTNTESNAPDTTDTTNTTTAPTEATVLSGVLSARFDPTVAISGVPYTSSSSTDSQVTQNDGTFTYEEDDDVTFTIAGREYTLAGKADTNEVDLVGENVDTLNNFKLMLKNLDVNGDSSDGIDLSNVTADIDPSLSTTEVNKKLYQATGNMPELLFSPSLGINTESPQAEADTAGQAMPFVDIFRTARPFQELSGVNAEFDENGWPTKVDPAVGVARTKILQGTLIDAIPSGTYTIVYDGNNGRIELGGPITNVMPLNNPNTNGLTFDLTLVESDDAEANAINLNIRGIIEGSGDYIKNLRVIMPGGTCKDISGVHNPFIRVSAQTDCPENTTYESFADRLIDSDRNTLDNIVFNPDYLNTLREFKVIRMMNLMESSHGTSSCAIENDGITEIDNDCVQEAVAWADRSKLSDAVWGGSGRTAHTERNGVPVEVVVALANTVKRDMWVNMPHYADDEFIRLFAEYTSANLDEALNTYIEYSNETWNPGFLGHFFVEERGIDEGLNTVPTEFGNFRDEEYFARLRFYSNRSLEIFNLWKAAFNDSNERLVRVLGTNQGDRVLSEQMILNIGEENVDAIAMAPYFWGCVEQVTSCANAPMVFKDATTTDDVFTIIDQDVSVDPSALSGTIDKMRIQSVIAQRYAVQLLAYEGGQHLTTSVLGRLDLNEAEKETYRALFRAANRDPRMKDRYETLLNAWMGFEDSGATLFTMYTLPQSYYRFGNWGIKEHLNKTRSESPKYDGIMTFQEAVKNCWWVDCNP